MNFDVTNVQEIQAKMFEQAKKNTEMYFTAVEQSVKVLRTFADSATKEMEKAFKA